MTLAEAEQKIEAWREDYNRQRSHSSLAYQMPEDAETEAAAKTDALLFRARGERETQAEAASSNRVQSVSPNS